jgi:integrase
MQQRHSDAAVAFRRRAPAPIRDHGRAGAVSVSSATRDLSHTFRHTTAMHLLESGVDVTVIALWLGHESPATTHLYVEADSP